MKVGKDMKKVLTTALLLAGITIAAFAFSYDTNVPLPGKSIAGNDLQSEMLFPIYMFGLRVATPDCHDLAITDTKVTKAKVDNTWQEVWTVKACKKTADIPINFNLNTNAKFAIDVMGVRTYTSK